MSNVAVPEEPKPPKRIRRTADQAKRLILDAAEGLISNTGPGGLRLQDVAAEVGLTHPVILHHFGSREGLMRALNERILQDLRRRLLLTLEGMGEPTPDVVDLLLENVFEVFRGGLAQRLVWLGVDAVPANDPPALIFRSFVDAMQVHREAALPSDPPISRGDTEMMVYLVAVAALGDAVFGANLLGTAPGSEASGAAENRFRAWLSRLLQVHLLTYDEPAAETVTS